MRRRLRRWWLRWRLAHYGLSGGQQADDQVEIFVRGVGPVTAADPLPVTEIAGSGSGSASDTMADGTEHVVTSAGTELLLTANADRVLAVVEHVGTSAGGDDGPVRVGNENVAAATGIAELEAGEILSIEYSGELRAIATGATNGRLLVNQLT